MQEKGYNDRMASALKKGIVWHYLSSTTQLACARFDSVATVPEGNPDRILTFTFIYTASDISQKKKNEMKSSWLKIVEPGKWKGDMMLPNLVRIIDVVKF